MFEVKQGKHNGELLVMRANSYLIQNNMHFNQTGLRARTHRWTESKNNRLRPEQQHSPPKVSCIKTTLQMIKLNISSENFKSQKILIKMRNSFHLKIRPSFPFSFI